MCHLFEGMGGGVRRFAIGVLLALASVSAAAQTVHEAPAGAPSTGRVTPQGEPGQALSVSGLVVGPEGQSATRRSTSIRQIRRGITASSRRATIAIHV
jgi:hypothetical protein